MPRRSQKRPPESLSGKRVEAAEGLRGLAAQLEGPIAEMMAQMAVITRARKALAPGEFDRDMAASAASLQRAINGAVAEQRQLQRHEMRLGDEMNEEEEAQVIAGFLRRCSREAREVFRQLLDELDEGDKVLS